MKIDWVKNIDFTLGAIVGMLIMYFFDYHWSAILVLPLVAYLFVTIIDMLFKKNKSHSSVRTLEERQDA